MRFLITDVVKRPRQGAPRAAGRSTGCLPTITVASSAHLQPIRAAASRRQDRSSRIDRQRARHHSDAWKYPCRLPFEAFSPKAVGRLQCGRFFCFSRKHRRKAQPIAHRRPLNPLRRVLIRWRTVWYLLHDAVDLARKQGLRQNRSPIPRLRDNRVLVYWLRLRFLRAGRSEPSASAAPIGAPQSVRRTSSVHSST